MAEPPASVISRATVLMVDSFEFGPGGNSVAGILLASEVVLAATATVCPERLGVSFDGTRLWLESGHLERKLTVVAMSCEVDRYLTANAYSCICIRCLLQVGLGGRVTSTAADDESDLLV